MAVQAIAQTNYAGQPVARVDLQGLERVSNQVVRSQLELQAGASYTPQAVARDLRRLYALGHFTTITVDVASAPNGVIVSYQFREKRVIDEIKIIGNDKLRDRLLRAAISWREGDSFLADGYNEEREAILAVYQAKGFPNTSVDIIVEQIGPGRVRITYTIVEVKKARISNIRFEGNTVMRKRQLRRLMKTKRKFWVLGGKYNEDVFELDLAMLLDEYGNYGRLESEILGTEFNYSKSGKNVDITIHIGEGPEYTVGDLDIASNNVFDDDEVLRIIDVQEGDVHNRGQVTADADLVEKGYVDSGYIFARVTPQVTLDRENSTTNVVHRVSEGSLKYVQEVKITGNSITRDEVLRRNIQLIPGDRFDGTSLRFSQRLLESLRYFDTVRFTKEVVEEDDRYSNLLVDVTESKTGEFSFGASFGTDEGIGGFTEVEFRNFDIANWPSFTGGGQNLKLRFETGERRNDFVIGFTDPEFAGYPLSVGFDLFNQERDFRGSNFNEHSAGGAVRIGKVLSPFVRTQLSLRYVDVSFTDIPTLAIRELRRLWSDEGSTLSLIGSLTRSTLNSNIDPATGSRHEFQVEFAGMGADHDYYKMQHDSTWYWPLTQKQDWILSYRTREGWVNNYGDTDFVPLSERFFLGGTSDIRGFDTRDIGPKLKRFGIFGQRYRVGGELRIANNIELKYKLTDQVRFYTFADAGGLWAEAGDFSLSDLKYSVGIGFGVDVPRLGPIRVDYGFPLNPDDDQGTGRLHLLTGFRF
jgi:outer membrane protein insertion porin family